MAVIPYRSYLQDALKPSQSPAMRRPERIVEGLTPVDMELQFKACGAIF